MGRMKFLGFVKIIFKKFFKKTGKFRLTKAPFTPLLLNGLLLCFLGILIFNFIYSHSLTLQKQKNELLKIDIAKIQQQISSWENITREFPGFRDAYLKLAVLNLKLSRAEEAKKYLDKVLAVDPNNKEALQLMINVQ